jgi:hypothetical protein
MKLGRAECFGTTAVDFELMQAVFKIDGWHERRHIDSLDAAVDCHVKGRVTTIV